MGLIGVYCGLPAPMVRRDLCWASQSWCSGFERQHGKALGLEPLADAWQNHGTFSFVKYLHLRAAMQPLGLQRSQRRHGYGTLYSSSTPKQILDVYLETFASTEPIILHQQAWVEPKGSNEPKLAQEPVDPSCQTGGSLLEAMLKSPDTAGAASIANMIIYGRTFLLSL